MMSNPKVSVLVPICNVEDYLEECLDSIANQTLKDIEVICINDGSQDGSKAIIEKYVARYQNFILLDKENSGYGDSMNRGIEIAKGEYIGIVESDDYIDKNMFEELYALANNGTVDVVKSNFWNFYEQKGRKHFDVADDRHMVKSTIKPITIYEEPQLLFGHPSIWSAIYKREFINKNNIRFMPEPGGGWTDNPFFFETMLLARSLQWINKPYYRYRRTNPNSSTNRQPDLTLAIRRMIDNLSVLEKYNINDEKLLVMTYARALMYINGVCQEKFYFYQKDEIYKNAAILLNKLNPEVLYRNFNNQDIAFYYKFLNILGNKMPKKEKILIYNWVPFANEIGWGGGVNIYCENLIRTILRESPNVDIYFLSSGFAYDAHDTECYIRTVNNIFGDRVKSFEVVNSPVPAAQDCILNNPSIALKNEILKSVVKRFIEQVGPFKTIHFNNIEGISLDCLDLKDDFSNTKFIYSMHNYVPICLHGFYFDRKNNCVCTANHSPDQCMECAKKGAKKNVSAELYNRAIKGIIDKQDVVSEETWIKKMGFDSLDTMSANQDLTEFSRLAISKINAKMDLVLTVSERVRKIALENGIREDITKTSYIGTMVAEFQHRKNVYKNENDCFKVVYLGANYKQIEKGYPFLMDSFEKIDSNEANKIDLILTTTNGDEVEMKKRLKDFHSVKVIHGYSHNQLREILLECDLGVIPVLWEDNLPQVAIEMVANGVPVLSSDLGGASELCSSPLFKFKGGESADFISKLLYLVNNPKELEEYWKNHSPLVTMHAHWEEMKRYYEVSDMEDVTLSGEEYRLLIEQNNFLLNAAKDAIYIDGRSWIKKKIDLFVDLCRKFVLYSKIEGIPWTLKASVKKLRMIVHR